MDAKTFIAMMWEAMQDVNLHGSHPSIVIAQAAVESGWGSSTLSQNYHNYFGVKATSSWRGKSVNMQTGEIIDGSKTVVNSNFRVYKSISDSIVDRVNILQKYYPKALQATTPEGEIEAIKAGGWATAMNYVNTIVNIVNTYQLTDYDLKLKKNMKAQTTYIIFLISGILVSGLAVYKLTHLK